MKLPPIRGNITAHKELQQVIWAYICITLRLALLRTFHCHEMWLLRFFFFFLPISCIKREMCLTSHKLALPLSSYLLQQPIRVIFISCPWLVCGQEIVFCSNDAAKWNCALKFNTDCNGKEKGKLIKVQMDIKAWFNEFVCLFLLYVAG